MKFSEELLMWYGANKRNLPWRATKDPYKIWLSEIMLQQTRVAQGLPYYRKFLKNFPTVCHLSEAPEKKVLKLWQGLGYYSRARNLHHTARKVCREMGGRFPSSYKGLLSLKGIGDYTASAIGSICFQLPEPVVDGNVYRVLARYYGIALPANSTEGVRYFKSIAREVMDTTQPGEYNQAIMEFGARQCVPGKPNCTACPLQYNCVALRDGRIDELPVKIRKTPPRKRYFNYVVPLDATKKTLLKQRKGRGIWEQLYEFPLLESAEGVSEQEIMSFIPELLPNKETVQLIPFNEEEIVHKLSHQHLHTRFWIVKINGQLEDGIAISEVDEYPVPVLIADFINTFKNSYF